MKMLRFLIFGLLVIVATTFARAQTTDPGWYCAGDQGVPATLLTFSTNQSNQGNGQSFSVNPPQPSAPVAEVVTPQIQALADGLQDNPTNIFNYVHDHIKFVLYFGSRKGAELTLLEKSGNDFDQSALLVALLTAAGYSNNVQYQFGWQEIPFDATSGNYDLHHWWQLTFYNTNWTNTFNYVDNLLFHRGYPQLFYLNDDNTFVIQRTWVELTIGSTIYQLDPAFKVSQAVATLPGFSLTNAMGSGSISNDLMSAAGGTDTGNYAQNLSESAVRSKLTAYTTNLLNYIQTNCPNASMQQILGGSQIVPANDPVDYSSGTYFTVVNPDGTMPVLSWTYEPTNLMSTLAITFAGTNYQWYMPQLQGQRVSLTFSNNGLAQLWQEDVPLAQRATSGSGYTNVVLAVTHPIGTWDLVNNVFIANPTNSANQTVTNAYLGTNATYVILYAFEPDWGWLQQRENKLDTYLQQGLPNSSRQVTSETLNIMGLNWLLQTAQVGQMEAPQLGILPQYSHRIGRMAQEAGKGYYVDVYMQFSNFAPSGGNDPAHIQTYYTAFNLWTFLSSALEHGIIEQLQNSNIVAASTVKMLEIANTNGQPVYLASSTNWTTGYNVQSHLTSGSYDSATLATIAGYISQGYYVMLPQNGTNRVSGAANSWSGYGYDAEQSGSGLSSVSVMRIGGGYNGGFASDPSATVNTAYTDESSDNQATYFAKTPVATPAPVTADPVDTADGTFQVEHTDLSLGQPEPRGLTLSRYYNGTRRFSNPAGMAGGWIHNYAITAHNVPAPQACLGGTTPAQSASMCTAIAAIIATYSTGSPDAKNWLTVDLIAKWAVDQMTRSGVSVNLGKDTLQFIQQPNGVFTPLANCTATLTQSNSAYRLLLRHGNQFNFNAAGLLTNLLDQYGQALNLTYNASNWVSTIKDWKNREFTFNYTGTPMQLTSVSDGTRTVSYGYSTGSNPQGDLTTFTDAEGKATTYVYDTNHQITGTVDALGHLVVSNLYDTQGHVTTQYTQGLTNKTWRIFWSGWQTVSQDPAGGRQTYFYDDQARLVGQQDALGNLSQIVYDGQNHVVTTVSPLNETNQTIYDWNNNAIQSVDPLGFATQYVYDANNNLIAAIDPLGHTNTFGYNAQFSLIGQTNAAGDWVNRAYNADGTLHTQTDIAGTTTYGYDSYGQLNSVTYPNSLGSESFVNSWLGDPTNHGDARGFATSFQYNNRRELTNSTGPTNLTTSVAFDAVGNVAGTMDARGNVTSKTWSATRHLLSTTLPATPAGAAVITNGYDVRDWQTSAVDALHNAMLYTNDPAGRLISQTDPLLRTTRLAYDADSHMLSTANAASETNRQTWDARGEMIQLTDGAGHFSTRVYDAAGNQVVLTNRNGKPWQFQFDAASRLFSTITPLGRSNVIVFNHQGLPTLLVDQAGRNTTNTYDALKHLTSRGDAVGLTTNVYDPNGNLLSTAEYGTSNVWTHDAYNRVSTYRDANGYAIQYRYDANGNLTNLIYPGGRVVTYAYDSLNQLTNVTDWSGRQTILRYDLDSRLTGITRPNGTYRTISYDAAGQVTNIWEQMANNLPIAWFRLNWTNSGNMAWEFAAPPPHTNTPPMRTMTYDADNRLATFKGPTMGTSQSVTVDADGNLTAGPLTNDAFTNYVYDARNRLLNAGGVTNSYDAINNLIGQNVGTNTTAYVVNPNAKLPQVLMRIKNGVTTYYIYGAGLLYQITEAATVTNTLTYHYDCRGSTIALSGDNGVPTDRVEYSLYGLTTYRTGTNDTPFLFNGRYGVQTDPNGLLYMRSRYYNPYLCRFINPDPSGFKGGLNFYAYANGNPVSYLDPYGLNAAATGDTDNSWYYNQLANPAGEPEDTFDKGVNVAYSIMDAPNRLAAATGIPPLVMAGVTMFVFPPEGAALAADSVIMDSLGTAVANPVPSMLARVIPNGIDVTTLGLPSDADVFVTDASQLEGLNAQQIAAKLALPESPTGFQVIRFPTPQNGLASPVFRSNPGFIGSGQTAGGASEFVIPNGPIPSGATTTIVY